MVHWTGHAKTSAIPSWLVDGSGRPRRQTGLGSSKPRTQGNPTRALPLRRAAVMVRPTRLCQALARAVSDWFSDLELIGPDGEGMAGRPGFSALLAALVRDESRLETVPASLTVALWRAAMGARADGAPMYPRAAAAAALNRIQSDISHGRPLRSARFAHLKAFLRRHGDIETRPALRDDHPSVAYQCGRLLGILAAIGQPSARGACRACAAPHLRLRARQPYCDSLRVASLHLRPSTPLRQWQSSRLETLVLCRKSLPSL